jgi:peptidoglycan hydrolase-like protein with peptidoglycan-binding domain
MVSFCQVLRQIHTVVSQPKAKSPWWALFITAPIPHDRKNYQKKLSEKIIRKNYWSPIMPAPIFTDIDSHWAKACILQLAERNIVKGYPEGVYRPEGAVTRAEFAALIFTVFPDALPVRSPLSFADVTDAHWAKTAVEWAYQRGFFTGYPDNTFRPDQKIPRVQAIAVLATVLQYAFPAISEETLQAYFDDFGDIPDYAKGAIAVSTLKSLVVNYPDVRKLRPNQAATRGEVAALWCQALGIPGTPPQYVTWGTQLGDIQGNMTVSFEMLKANARLIKELQTRLSVLKVYPGGRWLDGKYGARLEAAIAEFRAVLGLPTTRSIDAKFAQTLLTINPVTFVLQQAKNRQKVFDEFLQMESGYGADKLAFLDRGVQNSPYKAEIVQYPDRLREIPDGIEVVSLGNQVTLTGSGKTVTFSPYPNLGKVPDIDTTGLDFLHSDIQAACICVGSFVDGKLRSHWLGKNATTNRELWSGTKIVPLLNVVGRMNNQFPEVDADNCVIRSQGNSGGYKFYDLAVDLVSYKDAIASSNQIAAMFKQFDSPANLETWLKKITGNTSLRFRGRYGEDPFIYTPEVWDTKTRKRVLSSPSPGSEGGNTISPYDLTRIISMLGWHFHIPLEARTPGGQWDSLECVVRAMGNDSARYLDVAIDRLGLASVVRSTVIISKLGFGRSSVRNRTELIYTALLQFVDKRPRSESQPAVLRTIAMTLFGAKGLGNANREAIELDARMAAEVTEIVRRLMTQELA